MQQPGSTCFVLSIYGVESREVSLYVSALLQDILVWKVLCLFCSEICTPEGEKREAGQISKQSTQNLSYQNILHRCNYICGNVANCRGQLRKLGRCLHMQSQIIGILVGLNSELSRTPFKVIPREWTISSQVLIKWTEWSNGVYQGI